MLRRKEPSVQLGPVRPPSPFELREESMFGATSGVMGRQVGPLTIEERVSSVRYPVGFARKEMEQARIKALPTKFTPFQERAIRLKEREANLERLASKLNLTSTTSGYTMENIRKVPGQIVFGAATIPVFVGGRVGLAAEAATTKFGRRELVSAIKDVPGEAGRMFDPRQPVGLANILLMGAGTRAVGFKRAQKMVFKDLETAPIKFETSIGAKELRTAIESPLLLKKGGQVVGRPKRFPTTFRLEEVLGRPVTVFHRPIKRGTFKGVTVGKTQFQTITREVAGHKFVIKSITVPSGKTTTKIFQLKGGELNLLKTMKSVQTPTIKLTEPLALQGQRVVTVSKPRLRVDINKIIGKQRIVSAKAQKFQPFGEVTIRSLEKISAVEITPEVRVTGTPIFDLTKGTIGFKPTGIEIISKRFKFVPFPPKPKVALIERTEFGLFKKRPVVSFLEHRRFVKHKGFIEFQKIKPPKIFKEKVLKVSKQDLQYEKRLVEGYQRRTIERDLDIMAKERVATQQMKEVEQLTKKFPGLKLKRKVKTETLQLPKTRKVSATEMFVPELEFIGVKATGVPLLSQRTFNLTRQMERVVTKPVSISKAKLSIIQKPKSLLREKTQIKTKTQPKIKVREKVKLMLEQKIITRQLVRQRVKTLLEQTVGTKGVGSMGFGAGVPLIDVVVPRAGVLFPRGFGKTMIKPKKKRLKPQTKYRPQLVAIAFDTKIYGKPPKVLTGIQFERPIPL